VSSSAGFDIRHAEFYHIKTLDFMKVFYIKCNRKWSAVDSRRVEEVMTEKNSFPF